MNVDLYLFGDFGNGYTQYIDDNTRIKFKSFVEKAKANSQMIIHRDETLMYYTYIRSLHSESSNVRYIGISYVLSGNSIRDVEGLFSLFESAITTIASRGVILKYTPQGHITTNVEKIYQVKSEFAHISAYLKSELDTSLLDKKFALPTLDFSINTSEIKTFKFTDSHEEIIKSLATIPTIYIFKDKNYENEESKSFSNILSSLNKEKTNALKTIEKQKSEITKLKRAQKNYKLVIWLIIIIFIGLLCVMSYISNTNVKIQGLENDKIELNGIIEEKTNEINQARIDISNLQTEKNRLNSRVKKLENDSSSFQNQISSLTEERDDIKLELSKFKNKVNKAYPLIITDIEIANVNYEGKIQNNYGYSIYSYNTMYLKPRIKYTGLTSGYKTLKVKWYNPDGTIKRGTSSPVDFSQSQSIYVYDGDGHIEELSGWGNSTKGHWKSGTYRIEIWYENICLKSKTFTIH